MKMLLQFYEDETFGYKGIDDCENELLLEQIDHGKILFEQNEDEDREAFFNRIGRKPTNNEYGSNEKLDMKTCNKNQEIRVAVAWQGYALDRLVNDEDWHVRKAVAYQGYGLDRLINDENNEVREEVAFKAGRLGRKDILEKLVNDEDFNVRDMAQYYL